MRRRQRRHVSVVRFNRYHSRLWEGSRRDGGYVATIERLGGTWFIAFLPELCGGRELDATTQREAEADACKVYRALALRRA